MSSSSSANSPPLPEGLLLAAGWWPSVEALYAVPVRAYHHAGHVREVLEQWNRVDAAALWTHRLDTFIAVLLHDAVYVPGASDNEAKSAALVAPWCAQYAPGANPGRIERLILLTARHGSLTPDDVSTEEALFLDCDMAIVGSSPERFEEYDDQVRAEYAGLMPDAAFNHGRAAFLGGLLGKRIFLSDRFHAALAGRARANLQRTARRYDKVNSSNET